MSKAHSLIQQERTAVATYTNKTLTAPAINSPVISDPTYVGETTITSPTITGTVAGSASYTTPELDGPTFTSTAITLPSGSTLPSPIITGLQLQAASQAAGSQTTATKLLTAVANATATDAFTVTIPNIKNACGVQVLAVGSLGDGDSSDIRIYQLAFSRIAGANALVAVGSAVGAAATTGATANCALTITSGTVSGAVGATNTFKIKATVTRSTGASAAHVVCLRATLLNCFDDGASLNGCYIAAA